MKDKDTRELVIVFSLFICALLIGTYIRDSVGGLKGGIIGLLVIFLLTALLGMFAYFEYKCEEKDKQTKKRVKKMARAVSDSYKTRIVKDECNYPESLCIYGDHGRLIAIMKFVGANMEEREILEEALHLSFANKGSEQ